MVPRAVFMRVDQPPFDDVRVRHAISHAIDRQGLIEAIWGRGAPRAEQKRYKLTQAQRQAEIVADPRRQAIPPPRRRSGAEPYGPRVRPRRV